MKYTKRPIGITSYEKQQNYVVSLKKIQTVNALVNIAVKLVNLFE